MSLFTILLFVLIQNPLIKLVLAILYIIWAKLSGIRVKLLPNIILLSSIIIVNVLSPLGLVLFTLGPLKVTEGAMLIGIERAALLIGLLYISKTMDLSTIKLPGTFGILIKNTFLYFNQLTIGDKIKFKSMIVDIDNKLLNLNKLNQIKESESLTSKKNPWLYVSFIISLILFALDYFWFNK